VPEDLSLVGYDDTVFARLPRLSLTSVDAHIAEVGRAAGEVLTTVGAIRSVFVPASGVPASGVPASGTGGGGKGPASGVGSSPPPHPTDRGSTAKAQHRRSKSGRRMPSCYQRQGA